jgi:1-acyl-sn-glycerol-3-phosphate acyltransferase
MSAAAGERPEPDEVLAPATAWQLRWYAVARAAVAGFSHSFWRLRVSGSEHIPATGAFVLAPVHRSNVDTVLCGCVTRRRLRFMGKDSLWKYRWSAWFLSSLGGFPVHRGAADREALRTCEAALRQGEPVVLFPEGGRRSGRVVGPLFEGASFVAARAAVPIVPVGIGGSEWAMPKGARTLRPVRISIVVGRPIPAPEPAPGGRVSRRQVSATTAALQAELQTLLAEAMHRAGRAGPSGDSGH